MKKLLVIAAAALLMMGVAGQAQAYFTAGDLIQVMYDSKTNVEVATDLGVISGLSGVTNDKLAADGASSAVSLSSFGTGAAWSDVVVAYFGVSPLNTLAPSGSNPIQLWIGAQSAPTATMSKSGGIKNQIGSAIGVYTANTTTASAVITGSNPGYPNGYNTFAGGTYMGFLAAPGNYGAEVSAATDQQLNLYTYTFTSTRGTNPVMTQVSGILIDTNGGVTTINPSAVPIPPSILLMGSGLLGLVGIGRRKFFA
jgi:hypothetical protein